MALAYDSQNICWPLYNYTNTCVWQSGSVQLLLSIQYPFSKLFTIVEVHLSELFRLSHSYNYGLKSIRQHLHVVLHVHMHSHHIPHYTQLLYMYIHWSRMSACMLYPSCNYSDVCKGLAGWLLTLF